MELPLKGIIVLEFCQYLSGPSAGLRLADLGARVIKIERPKVGEAGRSLSIKNLWVGNDSLLFHTINRNKESYTANLKDAEELAAIRQLVKHAHIITHNFRPGVMEKSGLGYEAVKALNPGIIYAEVSGYGKHGPWKDLPGQDLLIQAISGLTFTSGNADQSPIPFGISIADMICGEHLVQGILASLIRKAKKGLGAHIEVSLLESLLDFQFELLTTYFASNRQPERSLINNGNPLLSAPYGIYQTQDGHIAIAMVNLLQLAEAIESDALAKAAVKNPFEYRDDIKQICADHLLTNTSQHWLNKLHAIDLWAIEVLDWQKLTGLPAYKQLQIEQVITVDEQQKIVTTRCPIRINGERLLSSKSAPLLGADTEKIKQEFQIA